MTVTSGWYSRCPVLCFPPTLSWGEVVLFVVTAPPLSRLVDVKVGLHVKRRFSRHRLRYRTLAEGMRRRLRSRDHRVSSEVEGLVECGEGIGVMVSILLSESAKI